jgi:hypothetical protein
MTTTRMYAEEIVAGVVGGNPHPCASRLVWIVRWLARCRTTICHTDDPLLQDGLLTWYLAWGERPLCTIDGRIARPLGHTFLQVLKVQAGCNELLVDFDHIRTSRIQPFFLTTAIARAWCRVCCWRVVLPKLRDLKGGAFFLEGSENFDRTSHAIAFFVVRTTATANKNRLSRGSVLETLCWSNNMSGWLASN